MFHCSLNASVLRSLCKQAGWVSLTHFAIVISITVYEHNCDSSLPCSTPFSLALVSFRSFVQLLMETADSKLY